MYLVKNNTTEKMTSKEIAELTGKQHAHVMRDIREHIEAGAIGRSNFGESSYLNEQNKSQPMYELDFEATMIVVTGYDVNRRAAVIRRWKALEEGTATPAHQFNIPQTYAEALKVAAEQAAENEKLHLQIETDRPKVIFADAVEVAKSSILVGDLAKLIRQNGVEIGQNRLFDWLRENGWLMKLGESKNMPTQKGMDRGLFEVRERTVNNPDGSVRVTKTTKVTGKGQQYFINVFLGEAA